MPIPSKNEIEVALEKESNKSILELTSSKIKQEKNDILQRIQLPRDQLKKYHLTLKHYRYIDNLKEIIVGNYIRWINLTNPENLINAETQLEINTTAHPLVYGDILINFLELLRTYVVSHIHAYHMLPADPSRVVLDVMEFPLDTILNKNINSN